MTFKITVRAKQDYNDSQTVFVSASCMEAAIRRAMASVKKTLPHFAECRYTPHVTEAEVVDGVIL